MTVRRTAVAYTSALALFAATLLGILSYGSTLPVPAGHVLSQVVAAAPAAPADAPAGLLLLQIAVILAVGRACGLAARALKQPEVIGEMAGGLLLGPSFLGLLWPAGQAWLFPAGSLDGIQLLSLIGLILFMFMVGMETDVDSLSPRAHQAVLISHASMLAPFAAGAALALVLYGEPYSPPGVAFTPFALFMGIAMSVTAFPVLARILHERGLTRSVPGSMALACAAVDDVTAWCVLAAVIGLVRHGAALPALKVVMLCALFGWVMLKVVRPALARWVRSREAAAAAVLVAFASAYATEAIGVHALFGAFLAGVLMPRDAEFRGVVEGRLVRFTTSLLLPLFFALTGLRTQVGLLGHGAGWLMFALVLAVAVAGKAGASAAAARWSGMAWRDSLAVGALMNTRGLVELVVLNIGYDLGLLSASTFTILVLMALATTLMTGPLLSLLLAAPAGARAASGVR